MSKIAVDVTPLLPGGINGGAKPMVLALLQELPRLLADNEFILWTADYSHEELAFLDRANLMRICIRFSNSDETEQQPNGLKRFIQKGWNLAKPWLPQRIQNQLRILYYRRHFSPLASTSLYEAHDVNFLFCPFGAPTFYRPDVPTLSIVYDLQFIDHPDFFTEQERFYRRLHFDQICKLADHVVTISEFTRQSVLKNSDLLPEQVTTIHIGLIHDYSVDFDTNEMLDVLGRLGLESGCYLFYPANFWAHKNHKTLLQGFQLFRQHNPESTLKLVLTGALDDRRKVLFEEAKKMELDGYITTPGFLPDHEIGILYRNARGLIFPSLYEGFGIPLLEAMQSGIPVACSNVTSLPEIGGNAVLYFDPENVPEISRAITALEYNDDLREQLVKKGFERLGYFGDSGTMAQNYASLIGNLLSQKKVARTYGVHGLSEDGWFQGKAYFGFPQSHQERAVSCAIHVPDWMPSGQEISVMQEEKQIETYYCARGSTLEISLALPLSAGVFEIRFSASYAPFELGISNDNRPLSALCDFFQIKSSNGTVLFDVFQRGQ